MRNISVVFDKQEQIIFGTGLLTPQEVLEMPRPEVNLFLGALDDWLDTNPVELLEDQEVVDSLRRQFQGFLSGSLIGTGGYGDSMRAGKAKEDSSGPN